jgi:hypothetical protein
VGVACVVAAALGVASCSAGGPKQASASPTARATAIADAHVVAHLSSCPATFPSGSLATLNAGIAGLDEQLVPIAAVNVLACTYDDAGAHLAGAVRLGATVAAPFEGDTNSISRQTLPLPACSPPPPSATSYFLIFASDAQRVRVGVPAGCAGLTNGVFVAAPAAQWRNQLRLYTLVQGAPAWPRSAA